ncbi:MAG: aspartate carbamoyltransferase [Fusobacteriaceae bacterium]
MNHFISISDFSKEQLLDILHLAKELKENPQPNLINNKIVATLFFEPSTRTRLSFTSAAYKIGGKVLGFDSPDGTSVQKGETLRDTIKVIQNYSDVIIMRNPLEGSAKFISDFSTVPIINAGDGSNEHPSQTFLDLFTIYEEQGKIEGLKIAFIGDLKYGRTVHSLTKALSFFNCEFYFVAPDIIQIPDYITEDLDKKNIKYNKLSDFKEILNNIDIMYVTRVQKERFDNINNYEKVKDSFIIKKSDLEKVKDNLIILHPLPRVNEIALDVDNTKFAKYFEQAANGIPVREALIGIALNKIKLNSNFNNDFSKVSCANKNIFTSNSIICKNTKCITRNEETENKYILEDNTKNCYYCGKKII